MITSTNVTKHIFLQFWMLPPEMIVVTPVVARSARSGIVAVAADRGNRSLNCGGTGW